MSLQVAILQADDAHAAQLDLIHFLVSELELLRSDISCVYAVEVSHDQVAIFVSHWDSPSMQFV